MIRKRQTIPFLVHCHIYFGAINTHIFLVEVGLVRCHDFDVDGVMQGNQFLASQDLLDKTVKTQN